MMTARNIQSSEFVRHVCVSAGGDCVAGITRHHVLIVSLPTMQDIGAFPVFDDTDDRVAISRLANCIVIGRWNRGIVCFRLTDGVMLWQNDTLCHITRVAICERDQTLQVESPHSASISILDVTTGQLVSTITRRVRRFTHPKASIDVYLTSDLELELQHDGRRPQILGKWCMFAIHDLCFAGDTIVVAGPKGYLGSYSMSSTKEIAIGSREDLFSRCGALGFDPVNSSISAMAFDYGPEETYALLRLDTTLALSKPIREYKRVFDVEFCLNGSHLINTNGELIDASSGDIVASTNWGLFPA